MPKEKDTQKQFYNLCYRARKRGYKVSIKERTYIPPIRKRSRIIERNFNNKGFSAFLLIPFSQD